MEACEGDDGESMGELGRGGGCETASMAASQKLVSSMDVVFIIDYYNGRNLQTLGYLWFPSQ
jgi:hypothetical protein